MSTSIKQFLDARGIRFLFHFTRLSNLPSILENGLLTKEKCASAHITPAINDHSRHDGTGAICATISYPNYKMFYRLRCENPGVEWVVLKLKSSLLWRTNCAFSDTNAGDGSVFKTPIEHRQGVAALRSMFEDYRHIQRATLRIPAHFSTNPQAEVLLLDGATIDDIQGAYFQNSKTQQQFMTHHADLQCHVSGGFFNGRCDHAHW